MGFKFCVTVQVFLFCVTTNVVTSNYSETKSRSTSASILEIGLNSLGLSPLYKLYDKCMGNDVTKTLEECMSTQMVLLLDQLVHKDRISVVDGVDLVEKQRVGGRSFSQDQELTEETLEASLPRSLDARQGILDNLMIDKISTFFQTHKLQMDLVEGRGQGMKLKKFLLPLLMGVVLKSASIIPVILSGMGILAIKALLTSKAALILTGIMGLRKALHKDEQHGHHKGSHNLFHHDLGASSLSHGIASLMHTMGGGDHHYGHGHAHDSHGSSSNHAALYGRSFNKIEDKVAVKRTAKVEKFKNSNLEKQKYTATEVPVYINKINIPGFTRTEVVKA